MRLLTRDGPGQATIQLAPHEVAALRRALEVILDGNHIWPIEFETRLGVTVDEATAVHRRLMDLPTMGEGRLEVTRTSVGLLADSLNEVVNGIGLENIDAPPGPADLLPELHAALREIEVALPALG